MLTTLAIAAVLSSQDAWDIKPNFAEKAKTSMAITVDAKVSGEDHTAKFNMVGSVTSINSEKNVKMTYAWDDLEVDGAPVGGDEVFEVLLSPEGAILSTTSSLGDDIRRMLSPLVFVYPGKAVKVGDKWSVSASPTKDKPDQAFVWSYEVAGVEKVTETDAMKISATVKEQRSGGTSGAGIWWVSKDGKVLKFTLDVKGWVVPMSGAETIDGKMTGVMITAKD